jgi:hypothetical protein
LSFFYTASEQRTSRLRSEIRQWSQLNTSHWRSVLAVTLTVKQALLSDRGGLLPLTEIQAKKELRYFMTRFNRAVYGHAARKGKKLRVVPIVEKDTYGRWHYHLAIEPPAHLNADQFASQIISSWSESPWAHRIHHIKSEAVRGWVYDEFQTRESTRPKLDPEKDGWRLYLLKKRGKSGLENWVDCIDLDTLNNP